MLPTIYHGPGKLALKLVRDMPVVKFLSNLENPLTSQIGFFQISNPSRATNIIPGFIDLDWWIGIHCKSQCQSRSGTSC